MAIWGSSTNSDTNLQSNVGVGVTVVLAAGGMAHALAIRKSVLAGNEDTANPHDSSLESAKRRLRRREESRRLVSTNPMLAKELNIGRPDLPSDFDDGGLIDVNYVPIDVFVDSCDLSPELASAIVENRDSIGGFRNRDDLEITLGLNPRLLAEFRIGSSSVDERSGPLAAGRLSCGD